MLEDEFHPTLNLISFADITTKQKVWWICQLGHEYETSFASRKYQKTGCVYCSNRKILPGFNDFAACNPRLLKQWDYSKNTIKPNQIFSHYTKKVWWVCERGHEWEATPSHRVNRSGECWFCIKQISEPEDSFFRLNPHIEKFYSSTNLLQKEFIKNNSNFSACWECPTCKDIWVERFADIRLRTNFCLNCYKTTLIASQEALLEKAKVSWGKRNLLPLDFPLSSKKKFWWTGECGHEWEARISHIECQFCFKGKPLVGFNDLTTTHPELASEWNFVKNKIDSIPERYSYGSGEEIWWQCERGHEWEARIYSRTSGTGCPICSNNGKSEKENELSDFLTKAGFSVIKNTRKVISPFELDIYLPDKQIAIEFNGLYWHSSKFKNDSYHYDKWKKADKKNIQLFQIWEDDWTFSPEIIKKNLLQVINSSPTKNEEKLTVVSISANTSKDFLIKNHIQGAFNGSAISYGLKLNNKIVSLAVFKHKKDADFEIIRYATSEQVENGFALLLQHFKKIHKPVTIIYVMDNCFPDNLFLKNNGFVFSKTVSPAYKYVLNKRRINLLEEKELNPSATLLKVWDAGKTIYKKLIT